MTRDEAWDRWQRQKQRIGSHSQRQARTVAIAFVAGGIVIVSLIAFFIGR